MNLGSPRDRTEHLLFRLSNKEITQPLYNVKFVVVVIGANNVEVKESEQVVFNGIVSVVDKVREVFQKGP